MPRNVDPRRGEDGYETDPPPFELADAEAVDLAKLLGLDPASSQADELRSNVNYIGQTYHRWKDRGAGAFTRAEARKALEDVLTEDRITYAAVLSLNERALQGVCDALDMMTPPPIPPNDFVVFALKEDRIDQATLRQAIANAITFLKGQSGPERDGETGWAVAELCRLYETLTGRRVTHSNKGKHMAYEQEPQSDAGRFVQQCFRSIDKLVWPSKISQAMRHVIKHRNSA